MKDKLKDIINHYGFDKQKLQAVEEMSELIKEILKDVNRGKLDYNAVADEISDVEIMLSQLKIIYRIPDASINNIKASKINRTLKRMEDQHEKNN